VFTSRRFIAAATVIIGLAALSAALSDGLSSTGRIVVVAVAATTLPAAVGWLVCSESGVYDRFFVVYADCGITVVLLALASSFDAMPGVALLAAVTLLLVLCASRALVVVQTLTAVAVLVLFVTRSILEGADVGLVLSRAATVSAIVVLPLAFDLLYRGLLAALNEIQRDAQTGLANRVGFELAASSEDGLAFLALSLRVVPVSDARPPRQPSDDEYRRLAEHLRASGGSTTIVARTAEAEFAVGSWFPGPSDASREVARWHRGLVRFRASQARDVQVQWGSVVVVHDGDDASRSWTVQRALSAAEVRRRIDTVELATTEDAPAPLISGADVLAVIESGGPEIVFQPICDVSTLTAVGFEALARFPSHTPAEWFAGAAASGLSGALERSAVENAVRAAGELPEQAFVSVNVSPTALVAERAITARLLAGSATRPIVLELTEHEEISDDETTRSALNVLRQAGIRIALDDVGAGYAGFRQIVAVGPDIIKIDAALIREHHRDSWRQAAVEALARFALDTGVTCVFEGVETSGELRSVEAMGGQLVQGFLLGRPDGAATF